jgi:HPt (histidine-containing phosphotransfer) domain-containing protein
MATFTKTSAIDKLQGIYIDSFPEKLAMFRQFLEENDWVNIERFGHQLKGSGKAYGFAEISVIGAKLEESANIHDGSSVRALQIELQNTMMDISRHQQENHDGK